MKYQNEKVHKNTLDFDITRTSHIFQMVLKEKYFKIATVLNCSSETQFLAKIYHHGQGKEKPIENEISFLENLSGKEFHSKFLLKYYGHTLISSKKSKFKNILIFENIPINFINLMKDPITSSNIESFLNVYECTIRALAHLQVNKIYPMDLRPLDIYYESINKPKFFNVGSLDENGKVCEGHPFMISMNRYHSPEMRYPQKSTNGEISKINPFKSACFSLGLMFLESFLGNIDEFREEMPELKFLNKKNQYFDQFKRKIQELKTDNTKNLIETLIDLVQQSLCFSPVFRPDFWELFMLAFKPNKKENELWKQSFFLALQEYSTVKEFLNGLNYFENKSPTNVEVSCMELKEKYQKMDVNLKKENQKNVNNDKIQEILSEEDVSEEKKENKEITIFEKHSQTLPQSKPISLIPNMLSVSLEDVEVEEVIGGFEFFKKFTSKPQIQNKKNTLSASTAPLELKYSPPFLKSKKYIYQKYLK